MLFQKSLSFGALVALSGLVHAQFPPKPVGVTVLESQIEEGIQLSYKEVSYSNRNEVQFFLKSN